MKQALRVATRGRAGFRGYYPPPACENHDFFKTAALSEGMIRFLYQKRLSEPEPDRFMMRSGIMIDTSSHSDKDLIFYGKRQTDPRTAGKPASDSL